MKLPAIALITVAAAATARASTQLSEYTASGRLAAASSLVETCELDVELRGAVVTVDVRQQLRNTGASPLGAIYDFDAPRGAVVIDASIRSDGQAEQAIAVATGAPSLVVDSPEVLGVDPALVEALPAGSPSQYRAIVQPIEPGHELVLTTRYAAVAELRGGAMRVVLPGRSGDDPLVTCQGNVHAVAGPGATISRIRVAGVAAPSHDRAPFALAATEVAIEAELELAGKQPVVWTQREELGQGWAATLVTVIAPAVRVVPATTNRALLVIDGSRSMELVGKRHVTQLVHAIGAALPMTTELDAIVFDRTATRVLGELRPATPQTLAAVEAAVDDHVAANGSDLIAAFELAHRTLAASPGPTKVIVITDGVIGDLGNRELLRALDLGPNAADIHAIILDPAHTTSPGADALRAAVDVEGGTVVELAADDLDRELAGVEDWLRPAWLELSFGGLAILDEVRAGSGFTHGLISRRTSALVLEGHGETALRVAARPGPAAPIAQLVLATSGTEDFLVTPDPTGGGHESAARVRAAQLALHPTVSGEVALAVLTKQGRIAASRRAMIRGGGRYERMVAVRDPVAAIITPVAGAPAAPSAISRPTLERLFRDQLQPAAYVCYQRALGLTPSFVAIARFELRMGRGEVTQVTLAPTGNPAFDACLLDAAYQLRPPAPDFTVNADDLTVATYPLTFNIREDRAVIVLGDADSASPIDIDALPGGVPLKPHAVKVDASTPLGNLRPSK